MSGKLPPGLLDKDFARVVISEPASTNSISSRPTLMDLKKVVAAEVARATCQMALPWKPADISYVVKRVGAASTLSFVMARTTL
jgi:hypothetical protein